VAQVVTLYVAGHEPTMAVIGTGLLALLRDPDQLARLRAEPALVANAVHELLRYDGPNQFVRRIAVRPLALGDRDIAPGDVLYAGIGAANRDPARWGPDAGRVRVDRPDAAQHVQFGQGIHRCLGAHLARLQAEVALGALVRLDGLAVAGEPEWSDRMVLRSLQRLPVTFVAHRGTPAYG
jgi:cytochrome P450